MPTPDLVAEICVWKRLLKRILYLCLYVWLLQVFEVRRMAFKNDTDNLQDIAIEYHHQR